MLQVCKIYFKNIYSHGSILKGKILKRIVCITGKTRYVRARHVTQGQDTLRTGQDMLRTVNTCYARARHVTYGARHVTYGQDMLRTGKTNATFVSSLDLINRMSPFKIPAWGSRERFQK